MEYTGPYLYKLFIAELRGQRILSRKEHNGVAADFKSPVTKTKQPKIYILKAGSKIVYVGYTSQPIGSRFYGGMRANGQNGYYGYQWKNYNRLDLTVFCFPPFSKVEKEREKEEKFAQAVEAELVYRVRKSTGEWPECQNEIHFFNVAKASAMAENIYQLVKD